MEKERRLSFFRSINGRVLLLLFFLSFYTAAALGVSGWNEAKNDNRLQNTALENNLNTYAKTVDTSLGLLRDNLMFFPLINEGMITLATEERGQEVSYSEHNAAIMQVQNGVNKMKIAYPYLEGVMIYYPGMDLLINGKTNPHVTDQVLSDIENDRGRNDNHIEWRYFVTEKEAYLYLYYFIQNGYIAGWIPTDTLWRHFGFEEYLDERVSLFGIVQSDGLVLEGQAAGEVFDISSLQKEKFTDQEVCIDAYLINADIYIVCRTRLSGSGGLFHTGRDYSYLLIIFCIDMLVLITTMVCLLFWVRKPIRYFISEINETRKDPEHRIGRLNGAVIEFESLFLEYNRLLDELRDTRIRIYEQQLEQKETKLRYLGQQIQPHFMLNALNTIYNSVYRSPDTVRGIIRQLSKYYRYVVNVESDYVQLGQELDHIRTYLEFQKMRLLNRITYEIVCSEELEVTPIPPFLLESFVGNSLKYGMDEEDRINIHIIVEQTGAFEVRITIRDEGPGFPEESLAALELFTRTREVDEELGVGIRNSIERLWLIYKDGARFSFYNDHGAVVELRINLQRNRREEK